MSPATSATAHPATASEGYGKTSLPLPVLIDLLSERVDVAKSHEAIAPVGCLGELIEQAIPHLQRLNRIDEAARA